MPAAIAAAGLLSAGLLTAAPALAQSSGRFIEPPSNLPALPRGDRDHPLSIDRLFDALKVAPDDASAKYVENRIWSMWIATDSDTTTLLMSRVKTAVDAKDSDSSASSCSPPSSASSPIISRPGTGAPPSTT